MTICNLIHIIMDKVCIYDVNTMENLWIGMIYDTPSKYIKLDIKIIGAKRKGIIDIGVSITEKDLIN